MRNGIGIVEIRPRRGAIVPQVGEAELTVDLLRRHVLAQGERLAELMALLHRPQARLSKSIQSDS